MSKRANLYAKIFLAAAVVLSSVVFYSCQTFTNVVSVGTAVLAVAGGVTGVIDSDTAFAIIDSSASVAAAAEEVSPQQEYYLGRAVAGTTQRSPRTARAGPPAHPDRPLRPRRGNGGLRRCRAARSRARALRRPAVAGRYARTVADRRHQRGPHGADAPAAIPGHLPAGHERRRLPPA